LGWPLENRVGGAGYSRRGNYQDGGSILP